MNKNREIIGTGLSGLVGSRLVQLYPQLNFADASLDTGVDILNRSSLSAFFDQNSNADAVIHLAAFTDTSQAWQQRGDKQGLCYRLNVEGTRNVLEQCQKHNKYLIHISTDFVFDGNKEGIYTENDTPNPIEWYGQTKYEAEQIILDSGHPAAIVRIAYPYRANFNQKPDIVRKIIAKFRSGETLTMFTDQQTTPTFTDDIANGLAQIARLQPRGIFHLVGSSSQSPYDLALSVAQTFDYDPKQVAPSLLSDFVNSQPPDSRPWQKNLSLGNQKALDLGIRLMDLSSGLSALKQQIHVLS